MSKRRTLICVAGWVLAAFAATPGSALAVKEWAPNGATVLGVSSAFTLIAENEAAETAIASCDSVTLSGTLGNNSNTWTITPGLNCAPDTTNGAWTAVDENAAQAALKIPATIKVELGIEGNCKLVFEMQSITKAMNYKNGPNGGGNPSRWEMDETANYIKQNPLKCFKPVEAGTAEIVATFLMINPAATATAIKVQN